VAGGSSFNGKVSGRREAFTYNKGSIFKILSTHSLREIASSLSRKEEISTEMVTKSITSGR